MEPLSYEDFNVLACTGKRAFHLEGGCPIHPRRRGEPAECPSSRPEPAQCSIEPTRRCTLSQPCAHATAPVRLR